MVYNHLRKLGCTNTAKRLLRIRNQPEFPELRGIPRLEYLLNDYKGKAMKSSPLLRPFCGSEFWGFSLLKI